MCSMNKLIILVALFLAVTSQCISPENKIVDWFVMLKMPGVYKTVYGNAGGPTLKAISAELTDEGSPIARTIAGIYKGTADNYLMYNDQVPDGPVSHRRGHTKGLIVIQGGNLTWIIHSVPNFPPQKHKGYSFPSTGMKYGQSFLCITLSKEQLPDIAKQLFYTWPQIYDHDFDRTQVGSDMKLVLSGKHVTNPPWTSLKVLATKGGTAFNIFAKFTDFNADLYSGWLTTHFKRSFFTETWQNGVGKLNSSCVGSYKVENIVRINLVGTDYKETQDHSKWAVSTDGSIICIGGINRAQSQLRRAGGAACFEEPTMAAQIRGSILQVEKCSKLVI